MHPKYIIAGDPKTVKGFLMKGMADFRHLKLIDKELKKNTFIFTPIADLPGIVLDLSDVEWIW